MEGRVGVGSLHLVYRPSLIPPFSELQSYPQLCWCRLIQRFFCFVLGALFCTLFSFILIITLFRILQWFFSFYMKLVFLNSLKGWGRTFLASQPCSSFFCCFHEALKIWHFSGDIPLFCPLPSFLFRPSLSFAAFILGLLTLHSIPNSFSSL